jgi:hypothetical protein
MTSDDDCEPHSADASISESSETAPYLQKPGWPRRPGTYPPAYPLENILQETPVPGQPLQLHTHSARSVDLVSPPPTAAEPEAARRLIDYRLTALSRRQRASRIVSAFTDFRPVDADPPPFRSKGWHYPSGKQAGTYLCASFEGKLQELVRAMVRA